MDFRKLTSKPTLARLTSPQEIFNALPGRSQGLAYLRNVQGQVLDLWDARRGERDLVIKMNTGSGKTIVGLLILQSCLNEGAGPALYVAPSPYLVEQVRAQARRLGVAHTDDPESTRYLSGQEIGIVNIHKLVNGRSVFGGPGSSRPTPLPIGSVVIDDAHAALATVEVQSTITIPSTHKVYGALRAMFRGDLLQQSETKLLDIESGDPSAVLRVPFWSWSDHIEDVLKLMNAAREDDPFKFALPLIKDSLRVSSAIFTATSLEIRPPYPPINAISSFATAGRRVYLTATLPDDSVLVSHFDAAADSLRKPITPKTAADIGDRLILAPQAINPDIEDEELRLAVRSFADRVNVVVLVPSHRSADRWVNVANVTAAADEIADVVSRLQTEHLGLVVLVNKYDGIDLPEDACRILVIDGLPEVYGPLDRRQAVALGDSEAMTGRQIQRVEQGMGRGVRSAEDHCVVLLLGARLVQRMADTRNRAKIGSATRAQIDLSDEISEELRDRPLSEINTVIEQVLSRDPAWVAASRARLAGVTYPEGLVDDGVLLAREAFNAACAGQFDKASDFMSKSVDASEDQRLKGWRQEELAVYRHQTDPASAQQVLVGALERNPHLTKPMRGVGYRRLTAADNQARAAAKFFKERYGSRNELVVGVNALLDDLAFDPERTDEFENAMESLGLHLGLAAQRPERDGGNGPDVLWALGGDRYAVIECKSGATAALIHRHDVAQLAHSMSWFAEKYGAGASGTPLLVHQVNVLASDATAPDACRIITSEKLGRLKDAVRKAVGALADGDKWNDPDAVAEQLKTNLLTSGEMLLFFSTASTMRKR